MNTLEVRFGRRTALVALTLLAACASEPGRRTPVDSDYPGSLLPPEALPHDVLWQQRVTASWGDGEQRGFDAAVQKQGDSLTVLGLSPTGSVGFVLRLRGGEVTFENRTDMAMPFPPRFVMLDVQRVLFPWLPGAPPLGVAERSGSRDGESVHEHWRDGRLVTRTFTRLDGKPAGTITVRYTWPTAVGGIGPVHALLDNGWLGYRLSIDTHAEHLLPAATDTGTKPPGGD